MSTFNINRGWLRPVAAAVFVAGFAAAAQAGECPADKRMANARQAVNLPGSGVTDTTLGAIDLGKEQAKITGRELRFRKMTIAPGGVVPWHSHEDRPALIYVVSGTINEYASNCAVPIEHKTGEVSVEKMGVQHWWKNTSKSPVVLLSADLFHDDKHTDDHMM
jgi:quercetin dioxygenase-like cupin family protein